MKYLITGASGLLGGNMAYILSHRHEVIGLDKEKANISKVNFMNVDLKDYEVLENILYSYQPDVVIHCAAIVNVDFCETNPKEAYLINSEVTENLAIICDKLKIKMVYISTDAVFDGRKIGTYRENDKVNPINIYGKSKLEGEYKVLKYKENIVIRTNIFGFNIKEQLSFGEWILNSMIDDKTIGMFYNVMFSPILVNDLTHLIEKLININEKGIFHICSTGSISKYDFGIKLKDIFQLSTGTINKSSIDDSKLIACRSKNMGLDNSKICNVLDLRIKDSIHYIREFRNLHENGYNELMKSFV